MNLPKIAVTMGDPSGVGPEVVLGSLAQDRVWRGCRLIVVGEYRVLEEVRDRLAIPVELRRAEAVEDQLDYGKGVIPVIDTGLVEKAKDIQVGEISALSGRVAVECIKKSVDLAMKGKVNGVVTAPINKEAIRKAGFDHIGHTEMLSGMTGSRESVTMFLVDNLRIFFHSRHRSLKQVIDGLTIEGVANSIDLADRCLRSIAVPNRRIALAALNPHASDGGLFGDEESQILIPAIEKARGEGIDISGPVPADSVFHHALEGVFDAVVSLYHDQGHIAAKTYDFFRTVSVTLGLPFVRTSVDHGTAFDIAWQGIANPVSMEEAMIACGNLVEKYLPDLI